MTTKRELEDAIRAIVDAWEGGDLAGAVNDAAFLLPDDEDEETETPEVYRPDPDFVAHDVCGKVDEVTACGSCGGMWCDRCDPVHGPLCPWCHGRGYSTAAIRRPVYRQANHVHPSEYTAQEDES